MTGSWIELRRPWNDTSVRNCPVCGQLIPRKCWSFEVEGGTLECCGPNCETLYWGYYVPTYGPLV